MSYKWDSASAGRKLASNVSVSVSAGIGAASLSVSKQVTGPHNPERDAYRACANCGRHANYHVNGQCPK